jgi:hypothetical protein
MISFAQMTYWAGGLKIFWGWRCGLGGLLLKALLFYLLLKNNNAYSVIIR